MATNPRAALIAQMARARGLDPAAVLSIASVEGGFNGAIGDHGTSFGPFQLHVGGALPSGLSGAKAQSWANSPEGIAYALDRIRQVAGGLQGREAIANISSRFERPADVPGEIAKASARYGSFASGTPAPQAPGVVGALPAPTGNVNAMPGAVDAFRSLAAAQLLEQSRRTLMGEGPDTQGLLGLALARKALGAADAGSAQPLRQEQSASSASSAAGLMSPAQGKIIGSPFQGTHAKDFNVRGGSDNWESENAVDVALPVGTPIRAATSGVIGPQFGSLGSGGRFAGLRLHLVGGGNELYYAHLSKIAPGLRPGSKVRAGQIIGFSGEANGVAHLHLATKSGNPLSLFK